MVRLKEAAEVPCLRRRSYFNSTMVRLKDGSDTKGKCSPEFQFHYGTIKRNNGTPCNTKSLYFNSTMVRLKEYLIMEKKFKVINFNSTMVRLKESDFCEMLYD